MACVGPEAIFKMVWGPYVLEVIWSVLDRCDGSLASVKVLGLPWEMTLWTKNYI